jgi:glycerol dehydrogenase
MRQYRGPETYVQGADALESCERALAALNGSAAYVLGGKTALSEGEEALRSALEAAEIEVVGVERGVSRCSRAAIERIITAARRADADLVIGIGGGHAIDTAKGVSAELHAELVVVPTVASTDAPTSAHAVLYNEQTGEYRGSLTRERNPELVVVDTQTIAEAPVQFLRYGMGDALATRFEAETCVRHDGIKTPSGGQPSRAGLTLARQCYENLKEYGAQAITAAEAGVVTPALETVVETNVLLSGIGFESTGVAAAHAYQEGFTLAGIDVPHGKAVALGTIAQLVLENQTEQLAEVVALGNSLGLVPTLTELEVEPEYIDEIARHATSAETAMSNEPFNISVKMAADALRVADRLVSDRT